ncbi:MAG: GIY-YIG nuclease family protein, partial [Legionellales bacterium]|nr:GIY-YIG nuclease family protein [Legionellales bacterium]
MIPGFTAKYNVHILVYYEIHATYIEAARREKRFKNWCRQWKLNLIETLNPDWRDLYEDICR